MVSLGNKLFNNLVEDSSLPKTLRSQVFVGTHCNYKCKFCYYKSQLKNKNDPSKVYSHMDYLKSEGIRDIEFTGGEPTIDPDWFNYLDYGKKIFRHMSVITNGQLMSDRDFTKDCHTHGLREVVFSLHGYDKESHEKITGIPGSWEKILNAIEYSKYIGLIVRLNCTVCSLNYEKLDRLALRIKEIKPIGVNFIPLNYWDGADESGVDIPYYLMAPNIKFAIDIIKGNVKFISVRYMPYCNMVGYEEYLCNWHQHTHDYWDWSNSFKKLPDFKYVDTRVFVDEVREFFYGKKLICLSCKYRGICDGVEKKILDNNLMEAHLGELIKDPMYYRKNYCTLEEYNRIINDKS